MSRIRPVTARPGTPMINIQSTLRSASDLCKNVSLLCSLVATVIHIQCLSSRLCVDTYSSKQRHAGRAKEIKRNGQHGMPCAKETFPRAMGSSALP